MGERRMAVVGIGAIGAVLAAALLSQDGDTVLVAPSPAKRQALKDEGLRVTGVLEYQARPRHVLASARELRDFAPEVVFIATKTFHLDGVLDDLREVAGPGTALISCHNGLGTEDVIAARYGAKSAFRVSMNYGAALTGPSTAQVAFFNRPNPLGAVDPAGRALGAELAALLTSAGLDTQLVEDIKLLVWKKMVMKCTMANICAVLDCTIRQGLESPPSRAIAERCFAEILAVAQAMGHGLGPDYMTQAYAYLDKVGQHKDSICVDLANGTRTEIDFLGGKVVEYARQAGLEVPYYETMTNLVRALEYRRLGGVPAAGR
ncbi:MAG: 2-dehydropantoate 2-reductase [Desulfarculus sp.]|nr:2-dehydropantoate 2-reductase [Desulfarculus sp.]